MDVLQENIHEVCDTVMERVRSSGGFYISVDMHCVDPAFAPGVYEGEPGGLSSRELIYFIKRLSLLDNFKGGDIVEINPEKDVHGMTIKLGAKLLSEMI
jgi:agmatinase